MKPATFTHDERDAISAALDRTYHHCSCGDPLITGAKTDNKDCDGDGWTVTEIWDLEHAWMKIAEATE